MSETLFFRADANVQIGSGHLMRCLALAQAWHSNGGKSVLITTSDSPLNQKWLDEGAQIEMLQAEAGSLQDAFQTIDIVNTPGSWVVIDGYVFDQNYFQKIASNKLHSVFIDDLGFSEPIDTNVILNQNIYATKSLYPSSQKTLLGPCYALLRKEFMKWQGWKPEIPDVAQQILLTMGGSDEHNTTLKVFQTLESLNMNHLHVVMVIGGSNPYLEQIKEAMTSSSVSTTLIHNTDDMATLMSQSHLAISASGSTCWELSFMGLPSTLVVLADNQEPIAKKLHESNIAFNLGHYTSLSIDSMTDSLKALIENKQQRTAMSEAGQALVDGNGAQRVLQSIKNFDENSLLNQQ